MNIDFSKAPDWAIGHALHAFGGEIREVWVGEYQYQRLDQLKAFPYGGGNSDHRHNPRRSEFHFEQLRPVLWTGEGMPPAGTVCEAMLPSAGHQWVEGLVVWHHPELEGSAAVIHGGGRLVGWSSAFRPIRTPEQIALEERERAINGMIADTNILTGIMSDRRIMAGQLYDAGYRKQVAL